MKTRIFRIMTALIIMISLLAPPSLAAEEKTPILHEATTNVDEMKAWAKKYNADPTFIDLAETFYRISVAFGVDPAVTYTQSAKETNFMKFTGVVTKDYHNPCGLKITKGGGDKDITAHKQFASWEEGITAQVHHLALYAGQKGFPRANTPDPRHFAAIYGKAPYVEDLGAKWAPSKSYGEEVVRYMKEMRGEILYKNPTTPDTLPNEEELLTTQIERLYGPNRYETARELALRSDRPDSTVVIASGENYPDALVGGVLSKTLRAKLYLSPTNSLPTALRETLENHRPERIVLLGGEASLTEKLEKELTPLTDKVIRIAGENRYETARKAASLQEERSTAILVNGQNFPDSLSIAPYAAREGFPLYLTDGENLTEEDAQALAGKTAALVVGGEKSMHSFLVQSLEKKGILVTRIEGKDRYETANRIAKTYFADSKAVILASGENFPDSLAASPLADRLEAPILLSPSQGLSGETESLLLSKKLDRITLVGGPSSLSQKISEKLEEFLGQ